MLWANGPRCPQRDDTNNEYRTRASKKNPEGKERHGLWKCRETRKQFTVRKGTIFEVRHLPLHLWLQAIPLMVSRKKGISSHQIHCVLGITYKSAWFLTHRIRECMRGGALAPFGSGADTVEMDETFIGTKHKKAEGPRHYAHKNVMLILVDRNTKQAQSIVVDDIKKDTQVPILRESIAKKAVIYTDVAKRYTRLSDDFAGHDFTTRSKGEYVKREKPQVHTNTVEGLYSIFNRGMKGVCLHCGKQNLHRYAPEFDIRYDNRKADGTDEAQWAANVLESASGKRLTY